MGDPKKHRKKYTVPSHPWNKNRLDEENVLRKEYALKNKKELYKINSFLKNIKSETKKLTSSNTEQSKKEMKLLIDKLRKFDLVADAGNVDSILGLELKNVMERRLQHIVLKKGLANSAKQARQLIVHEHISVGDKKITSPNYLVKVSEEKDVSFDPSSPLSRDDHPERIVAVRDIKREIEKIKPKKEEPIDEDLDVPEVIGPTEDEEIVIPEDAEEIEIAAEIEDEKKEETTAENMTEEKGKNE